MSTKSKANGKSGKSTTKKPGTASSKGKKKRTNLLKLCSEMNNYVVDANDKEIIKRFKTTISSSMEEDITKSSIDLIFNNPKDVDVSTFSESIQPYIKHYLFMVKRDKNKK